MGAHVSGKVPPVTIVLPTYNHLPHLPAAIGSILSQTRPDFELIVVDDGSTDGTREYLDGLADPRIRVVRQANTRLPGALNAGMGLAKGDLLTWTSADNILAPDFLEVMTAAFDAFPEAGFACSGFAWIDAHDAVTRVTNGQDLSRPSLLCANPGIASFMYRRECHETLGGYDPELEGAEDWDMWIRIVERYVPVLVDAVPYYYRAHADTMTTRIPDKIRSSCRRAFEKAVARMGGLPDAKALYPAVQACVDRRVAEAHANFDFGSRLLVAPSGFLDHAAAYLGKALEIKPDFAEAAWNLVLACGRGGDREGLFRAIERLSLASPSKAAELLAFLGNDVKAWRPDDFARLTPVRTAPGSTELERRTEPVRRFGGETVKKTETEEIPSMNEPNLPGAAPAGNDPLSAGEGCTSALPASVHFLMNDKCNARCVMCGGDYYRSRSGRAITLDKFRTMAANLRLERFGSAVLSGAGDPLLNPDLIPIVAFLNERYPGVQVHITTNGIALDRAMSERLLSHRIASVNVSINAASRATYLRIMQVDRFDNVLRNLLDFIAARREKGSRCLLQLSSALNLLNIRELPVLVEIAKRAGAASVNTMYCRFYPERLRTRVAVSPENALQESDSLFFHQALSDEMVIESAARAEKLGIRLSHDPLFRENAPGRQCRWPETEIMVGFDGEVYPCGGAEVQFREKVEGGIYDFGNALRESIDAFWNGDLYRKLRVSSRGERRIVPECDCCANLMKATDVRSHIMQWEAPPAQAPAGVEAAATRETATGAPSGAAGAREPGAVTEERGGEPLVSVIVPTHNRPKMLAAAIRSILAQTFRDFEIVVVNDAGPDVAGVVESLNGGKNITYARHSRNRGLAATRNTGVRIARGRYIAYLDDDDLFYPDHLRTLVDALSGGARVAYTDAHRARQLPQGDEYVTVSRDVPYSSDFERDRILYENYIPVLCFMHEKALFEAVGCFDESLTSHEDWELWIRMSAKAEFRHIPKVTCEFSWREDGSTMTSSRRDDYLRTTLRLYEKHAADVAGRPDLQERRRVHLSAHFGIEEARPATGTPRVSIVIPVFNNLAYTRDCIESIAANSGEAVAYELIVVDNGSTDGTREFLATLGGDVKIITNAENLGFAKACNMGAASAAADCVLFLNNDTVVHPGWLEGLLRSYGQTGADICGAKLLYPDGTLQHAGVAFAPGGPLHLFRGYPGDLPAANKLRELSCVTAACMLVRKSLFERLGGFDDAYRNGFEDVDFCLRAKEAGARIVYTPECVVTHFESKTPGRKANEEENTLLLTRRWGGRTPIDDESIYESEGFILIPGGNGKGYLLDSNQPAFENLETLDAKSIVPTGVPKEIELRARQAIHAFAGRKLIGLKKHELAAEHLLAAHELGERSVSVELADCLARIGKAEEAERLYGEALALGSGADRAQVGLGVLRLMAGDAQGASDRFRDAIALNGSNSRALCGAGISANALGKEDEGYGWFCRALDVDPSNLTAIHELTKAAFAQGRFAEAEARIRKFLEFEPSNAHMLFSLAGICHKQGKRADALDALDRLDLFSPGYDGAEQLRQQATA